MVGGLRFYLDGTHDFFAFFRAFDEHFFKQRERHIMRARRRYEIAAAFYEFHTQNIDVFVTSVRVLNLACALAECGRVENDQIEFFAVVFVCSKHLEHVAALGGDVGYSVEARVLVDVVERGFRALLYLVQDDLIIHESREPFNTFWVKNGFYFAFLIVFN